ncbi:MAG: V-type ATP synthase subunit D [Methylobacter sp.]|uniref:V-type ATP synthase subunit D n=1 Tax=Methylobacter sp. TaxID=2051955 RepID=UPI00258B99AF|nr:V-type ATP synthase subunit D [Methylobacter sp.]MCL7421960.1 V-type ATP synthase subunit D [Methylobacter sp.]
MARLSLSKTALHKESAQLKRYRQYLPSLDLKRQQLLAERYRAAASLAETERMMRQCREFVLRELPMLAETQVGLQGLVTVSSIKVSEENIVGILVPVLEHIDIHVQPYSTYAKPHWVDAAVIQLKRMMELKVKYQVGRRRLDTLDTAVKKVTQRVNLFDKVLIPKAEQNIKRIRISLSDTERAGVVRAKITKQKRQH